MVLAPIVLFVYSRLEHTKKTVEALKENSLAKKSDLIIFSDAPKNEKAKKSVEEVRKYIHSIKNGFKSIKIVERKENFGLANSIIDGVTKIVNKYDRIIVLEDDLVTSKYFLNFMNDSLQFYENESKVISISGYIYPISGLPQTFFLKGADCWGWATWKRGWRLFEKNGKKLLKQIETKKLNDEFDFNNSYPFTQMLKDQVEGKNNSWAVRWYASAFLKNKLTLYPGKSFVQNIGNDSSGVHNKSKTSWLDVTLNESPIKISLININEISSIRNKFSNFFKFRLGLIGKILMKIVYFSGMLK
jgi:hypothetical protein